jgi:beta-xylosidase
MIRNPILPEFNPDPSICRVGEDYYIATSTFEWFPGVQIHHSRDLVNWRLIRRPLERASQLDMRGEPDSCKIWAPCLSYADGKFWLVYTDVKRFDGNFKDAHLCSRPLKGVRRSPLGRETGIQKCVWGEDGWLRLAHGGQVPAIDVPAPFAAPTSRNPAGRPIPSRRTPAYRSISSG